MPVPELVRHHDQSLQLGGGYPAAGKSDTRQMTIGCGMRREHARTTIGGTGHGSTVLAVRGVMADRQVTGGRPIDDQTWSLDYRLL